MLSLKNISKHSTYATKTHPEIFKVKKNLSYPEFVATMYKTKLKNIVCSRLNFKFLQVMSYNNETRIGALFFNLFKCRTPTVIDINA